MDLVVKVEHPVLLFVVDKKILPGRFSSYSIKPDFMLYFLTENSSYFHKLFFLFLTCLLFLNLSDFSHEINKASC